MRSLSVAEEPIFPEEYLLSINTKSVGWYGGERYVIISHQSLIRHFKRVFIE